MHENRQRNTVRHVVVNLWGTEFEACVDMLLNMDPTVKDIGGDDLPVAFLSPPG